VSGALLCLLAFLTCFGSGVANWRIGLCVLMGWGYFFGILKANFVQSLGHFIFDAATVGFYACLIVRQPSQFEKMKWATIYPWVVALIVWPLFMAVVPLQHYLVQLVGLRGNVFWIPMLLVGSMLDATGRLFLAYAFAMLNCVAFGFSLAEYFLGVELFVPDNEVTQIVHLSSDIAGGHKRIPSTFTNAHSYAGTMVATVPWILGGILDKAKIKLPSFFGTPFLIAGLIAAVLGVFIAGPRSPVLILGMLVVFYVFRGGLNLGFLALVALVGGVVAYYVAQDERMQRFTELQDIEVIQWRLGISVNMNFFEVMANYPMGNGMGAGGTSLPYFIQGYLANEVILENEYARIMLEQGLPGLFIMLSFIFWFVTRKVNKSREAQSTKKLLWFHVIITFMFGVIGIGMMTSVPTSAMFLMAIGYATACLETTHLNPNLSLANQNYRRNVTMPAYQRGMAKV